ncbi:low molecular weight protein arginine phosphatase [Halobacillus sp. ACCC02827]|uniref:low molecular weight protein arginine phosphatase n=1 Tax=Bacillaceae TaxID=186817 RepID=UPI0002A51F3D|nr:MULTISPECIES: low molecular weight protein arginine phosphatase [Bacillaceae]ELK49039.1 protein-tyrosine-phosphatase [Halobacillus sp. BAB-2008]QHT48167.1 low molecular weight protein arginine phosphatase [Bacillus sp. SB49]WJE15401.1 low molecular weight protein arginine phosphatase [Halobacillus sp. ACCC02827]
MNILFVCTGNTCRSPMAEALLKSKWDKGEVRSAGIFAGKGEPLAKNSELVLKEKDLTMNHQAVNVDDDLLEWADIVLTMTDRHKQTLALQYPYHQDKYFTLKEYVVLDENKWNRLKDLYSSFEEKRSILLRNASEDHSDPQELEQRLYEELQQEIEEIKSLEEELPDLNISDPFGGSIHIYRSTRDEIEKYLDLLVAKWQGDKA